MIYSHNLRKLSRLALASTLALSAIAAHADLKIVSKSTVTTQRGPQVITIITYIKGPLIRIDNFDVTEITNSRTHKSTFINRTRKIYTVAGQNEATATANKSIKSQHMKITAHIKPTGKTKKIAGKNASQYVGDLVVTGDYPKNPGSTAKALIHLDEWTLQGAKGVSVSQSDMLGTVGNLLHSLAGVSTMNKVTQELQKIKGVPLNIDVELTLTIFNPSGGAPETQKHSYVTEAQFVKDSTLPADAFEVPKGYKLVTAPKPAPASKTSKPAKKKK